MVVIYAEPENSCECAADSRPSPGAAGHWRGTLSLSGPPAARPLIPPTASRDTASRRSSELAAVVDRVLAEQLSHLKQFAER